MTPDDLTPEHMQLLLDLAHADAEDFNAVLARAIGRIVHGDTSDQYRALTAHADRARLTHLELRSAWLRAAAGAPVAVARVEAHDEFYGEDSDAR